MPTNVGRASIRMTPTLSVLPNPSLGILLQASIPTTSTSAPPEKTRPTKPKDLRRLSEWIQKQRGNKKDEEVDRPRTLQEFSGTRRSDSRQGVCRAARIRVHAALGHAYALATPREEM